MTTAVKIAVTGGAGQIAYALLFRAASGALLGPEQPISLSLLEIPPALPALDGVEMELRDCAMSPVADIVKTDNPETAFADADIVFLVGARPRGSGMERKDLLQANASIFSEQGKALNRAAKKTVKIIVVGNPANTNCLIARANAPDLPDSAFSAMTRLDHNRAVAQLASRAQVAVDQVRRVVVWGNHSATQYPDIHHASIAGRPALQVVGEEWYRNEMIPAVQQRGHQGARRVLGRLGRLGRAGPHVRMGLRILPRQLHQRGPRLRRGIRRGSRAGLLLSRPLPRRRQGEHCGGAGNE